MSTKTLTREVAHRMPPGSQINKLVAALVMGQADESSLPPYGTDITAAFEVVEDMSSKGWEFELHCWPDGSNRVVFARPKGHLYEYAHSTSTPLAISRAALKAVLAA